MKMISRLKTLNFRQYMLFSAGVGIVVGILTVLGQEVLPGNWGSLANSGTAWLIPAFFVGGLGPSKLKAAVASILTLCGMVTGYYGYAMTIQDVAHSVFYILVWAGAAILGGLIFGIAGFLWGQDQGSKHKYGSALIGGVFITEGLDLYLHIDDYGHMLPVGAVKITVGFILLLVLERSNKERVASLLALIPVIVLGLIGYQILHSIT
ncbi:DUF6518 family protein [Paenibacillus ginsengarvi]|nr:DUF6518 family protein [Paenibacillus ginsengarvi]